MYYDLDVKTLSELEDLPFEQAEEYLLEVVKDYAVLTQSDIK